MGVFGNTFLSIYVWCIFNKKGTKYSNTSFMSSILYLKVFAQHQGEINYEVRVSFRYLVHRPRDRHAGRQWREDFHGLAGLP